MTAAWAADDTVIYSSPEEGEAGLADEETKFPFTLKAPLGRTYFYISVFEPVGFTVTLYDKEGIAVADPIYIPSTSQHWEQYPDGFYKNGDSWTNIPSDDYFYGVKLDVDATYYLDIWHVPYKGKLSETDTVITAGFTKKLSLSGAKVKKWSASEESVAAVDSKGKVTAKKAGKTLIRAKLDNGEVLTCHVIVKANKYSVRRIVLGDVPDGQWGIAAYAASFDAKGNLVVKARIANNENGRLTQFRNLKITVKDGNGKTVGTYAAGIKNLTVPVYSVKDVSFRIARSKLKMKKADLRQAEIACRADAYGYKNDR